MFQRGITIALTLLFPSACLASEGTAAGWIAIFLIAGILLSAKIYVPAYFIVWISRRHLGFSNKLIANVIPGLGFITLFAVEIHSSNSDTPIGVALTALCGGLIVSITYAVLLARNWKSWLAT